MQKKYAPVRVKNPSAKNVLIRLLQGQQLNLVFDKPNFLEYKIDIAGSFLAVDDIIQINSGWVANITQKNQDVNLESALFLGEISLYNNDNIKSSSLCVVTNASNNDVLRIVNPTDCNISVEPHQVLEVVFKGKSLTERWVPFPSGKEMVLEQIQHSFNKSCNIKNFDLIFEETHRFRFNAASIEYLSEKPVGKYDGGNLFFTGFGRNCTLGITCSWKGKGQLYNALLLPKHIGSTSPFKGWGRIKKCLHSEVTLCKIDCPSIETGCVVLTSG